MSKRPGRINVFISSTSSDLKEYRAEVRDVALALGFHPIMMEYFPAMDANAVKVCMDKVDESDIYIGIFAHRYGFCPQDSDISITEMEFNRATRNGIPRLCFLIDENAEWPGEIEGEPGHSKLLAFKKRLDSNLVRATFDSPDSLATDVSVALQAYQVPGAAGGRGRRLRWLLLLIGLIASLAVGLFLLSRRNPSDVKVAYQFLVDTSENMRETIDGIPRSQIVSNAIEAIISSPGSSVAQVWRGLRLAGGGCDQTELVKQGTNVGVDDFIAPLKNRIAAGSNAYMKGLDATFRDMSLPEPSASDVRIVFIFLGSVDPKPCSKNLSIPLTLLNYKNQGITTALCTFALLDDSRFASFKADMSQRGFGCVHNPDDAEEISRIAIDVIEQQINLARQKRNEQALTPYELPSETPLPTLSLTPTLTLTNTPTATRTSTPTDTPTSTLTPTQTTRPTTTPFDFDPAQLQATIMEATLLAATSRVTDTSTPNATQTSGAIMTQTAQFNATGTTVSGLQTAQAVSNASATANAQADLQPLEMTQLARLNAQQAQSATEINGVTKVPNTGEITFPTASLTDDLSPTTDAVLTVTPSATATPTATATRTPTPTQTPSPTIAPAQTPTAALVSPTASPTETDTPQPVSTLPPVAIVSGTQSINLRAGAGTTFTIITALQPGTSLIILEQDNTTGWTKVRMGDGREGWVSSTLLRVVGTATPVPTSVSGEVTGCPAVVQQIINSVSAVCSGLARNTACYAHDTVNASLLQPTRKLVFNAPGDQIDIAELSSLQLSKYNTDTGDWGIVILNVESTFADALPGASVTVILAGEGNPTTKQFSMDQSGRVNVSYNIEPQYGSIQAYYLVPGVSSPQCRVLPASLIIQSPQGAIKLDIASDRIVFTSDPAK